MDVCGFAAMIASLETVTILIKGTGANGSSNNPAFGRVGVVFSTANGWAYH